MRRTRPHRAVAQTRGGHSSYCGARSRTLSPGRTLARAHPARALARHAPDSGLHALYVGRVTPPRGQRPRPRPGWRRGATSAPSRRSGRPRLTLALALLTLCPGAAAAGVLDEARELRRQLRYDEATGLLESRLGSLDGVERGQALLLLAALSTDHKDTRRLLRDAASASDTPAVQRAADLELARLDYARGNYNNVRSRLERYADAECRLLFAQAQAALGETAKVTRALEGLGQLEQAELLRSWAARESGDPQGALARLERLAAARPDVLPVALLWKAECEVQLGRAQQARETLTTLRRDFPDAPEAVLAEPTLATLRRETPLPERPESGQVVLQLGIFEDRRNALRFRESLPASIGPAELDEFPQDGRRMYRVRLGPFDSRAAAEQYARTRLEPARLEWRVAPVISP